jgi:hypothetical protein
VENLDEPGLQFSIQDGRSEAIGRTNQMDLPARLRHEIWKLCCEPEALEANHYTQDKAELLSTLVSVTQLNTICSGFGRKTP